MRGPAATQPQSRSSFACSLSLSIREARVAAVVRALATHQYGPGSNPGADAICGLSLLLVLSLAPPGFSPGTPVSLSSQKPTFPNSKSTRNQVDEEPLSGCATSKSLFIYLFIYLSAWQKRAKTCAIKWWLVSFIYISLVSISWRALLEPISGGNHKNQSELERKQI